MRDVTKRTAYLTDYWTLRDDLRFSDFRPALLNILMKAQTPLTIGVFGPWGSGKTSLLRMLKGDIERESLRFVRPVWFTAWKYDRHEALWRAFILRVLDALYPREPGEGSWEEHPRLPDPQGEQKRQVDILQRLEESVYQPVDWEELGRWTVNWWQAAQAGGQAAAEIAAALIPGAAFFKDALARVLNGEQGADVLSREVHAYHREQLASMEQFEATFQEALRLILGDEGRLVVFVDDLDRCLPEKAVEVLEAIKLFLDVEGCVFVIGVDRGVIERGIQVKYRELQRTLGVEAEEARQLPVISGADYLQKIVQIPFHLPPLAVEDLEEYILALERDVRADARLSEMTRAVFANGLFPNPRQVKRALNIFRLLREIALAREERGGLPKESVAWPLLAKTVLIQTQWPKLYDKWRHYHTLVQTLEEAYAREPATEEDALWGRLVLPRSKGGEGEEASEGGLLTPYLRDRRRYALLERTMTFPEPEKTGRGRERARFEGLSREEMAIYMRLAGAVEAPEPFLKAPADLLAEMLSGDRAQVQEAAARLAEQEPEREGPLHRALRKRLLEVVREPARPAWQRVSTGDALALLGDPRFRPDAWHLPDEPLLGFIEVPEGPFLMGTREEEIPGLLERFGGEQEWYEREVPQHEVILPPYYIARYPVTVAQFRAFVEASGHQPEDEGSLRGLDNHPVVRVSWYEALKYCEWLTEIFRGWERMPEPLAMLLRERRWLITLPSEAEWEKAARGTDGRTVPWGDEPDSEQANYSDTAIGTTSTVGCFPRGVSTYGVEDLNGNVWEWTRSLLKAYPYAPGDGREDLEAVGSWVVRGGSFSSSRGRVRCAARSGDVPGSVNWRRGFRLVAALVRL